MNTLFVAQCPKCHGDRVTFSSFNRDYLCQDCRWEGNKTQLELVPLERKHGDTDKSNPSGFSENAT